MLSAELCLVLRFFFGGSFFFRRSLFSSFFFGRSRFGSGFFGRGGFRGSFFGRSWLGGCFFFDRGRFGSGFFFVSVIVVAFAMLMVVSIAGGVGSRSFGVAVGRTARATDGEQAQAEEHQEKAKFFHVSSSLK